MQVKDIRLDETRRELTQHGTPDFPLAIYTTRISRNVLGLIDWHWHKELQFCMVTSGRVDFSVNRATLTLGVGDGLFVNADQLHMAANHPGTDSSYLCLDFDPRMIAGFDGSAVRKRYVEPFITDGSTPYLPLSRGDAEQARVLGLLEQICENYQGADRDELLITIWLSTAWHQLTQALAREGRPRSEHMRPQVREMIAYVNEHYADGVTLDALARHVGFAKGTCCREFKRQLGCTLSSYVLNLRLQEASRLLEGTDESISRIASACGFSSSSYFITRFKERSGDTPRAYRQRFRGAR